MGTTYHPEERLVGKVLVLLDGGEDAEYEADEDHHEPERGKGREIDTSQQIDAK